ncbi:MAG TPA: Gldg family protein [Isosphaeraceae bacterium]
MATLQENKTSTGAPGRPAARVARGPLPFRPHVVGAVFWRNFAGYFSNPAGYVFIFLFVLACSAAEFWRPVFFASNLANLDPLNELMPLLLLFFVPAITMGLWAEERRQGTDELLLTLPARDVEVVLGKYLAALGIYSVALAFLAVGHFGLLYSLGQPDFGVLCATLLGYWLMGAMFIAIGLVASLVSSNVTVAFILGGLFCAVPVFAGLIGSPTGSQTRRLIEGLSAPAQFRDFGAGVVPIAGVVYFLALAAAMLYLNTVLVGRRHWAGGQGRLGHWGHLVARVAALVVALIVLDVMVARAGWRPDVSAERINTLTPESRRLIAQIPAERPVFIQAYYSPEVPREYVETKANLINLLKEYEALGGGKIRLNLVETERFSKEARDAERRFGIKPRRVLTVDEERQAAPEIFLGVAFTSGPEEVVVPFFDRGLPVEYELTRSIRVASAARRKKVGILSTDAKLLGGFDFRMMDQESEWQIVTELKKQYEVSSVAADATIPADLDALLVAQPASLTQPQIENLTAYVRGGGPTLLLLDPLPRFDPSLAPGVPRQSPGGMFGGGPPPEPKGDLGPLLTLLGLDWPTDQVTWNTYNPHPKLVDLPPEFVFIKARRDAPDAFNPAQDITKGLQEVVLLFPGLLRPRGGAGPDFTPLLRTGVTGGAVRFDDIVQRSFLGVGVDPSLAPHFPSGDAYTLAARIQGKPAPAPEAPKAGAEAKKDEAKKNETARPADVRVVAIADLDLISDGFFNLRQQRVEGFEFDNVTFVLNCVDVLAGDEAFVGLRKHRPQFRTLEALENQARTFDADRLAEEKKAEDDARVELAAAQKRLDEAVAKVRESQEYDERTKEIMVQYRQDVEQRRLDVVKANIEDQKRQKIEEARADKEQRLRATQNRVRAAAILWPPLPALLLGGLVFAVRARRENRGANPNRLA